MKKRTNDLRKNKNKREHWHWVVDVIIAIVLAAMSMIALPEDFRIFFEEVMNKDMNPLPIVASVIIAVVVFSLYFIKMSLYRKGIKTHNQYLREEKINKINQAVFSALYKSNSVKMREIFRYTYGTVPKWNPIDYRSNVLVYDVHEQIRSIIISLKECVIDIDPERFNDKNVSVELVYCYPEEKKQNSDANASSKFKWKLISSGDTSGNKKPVLSFLKKVNSFYVLTNGLGTVFKNNKLSEIEDYQKDFLFKGKKTQKKDKALDIAAFLKSLFSQKKQSNDDSNNQNNSTYYIPDVRDLEHSKDGSQYGSVIGTVINIKNDCPEKILVKAILTINTYGEKLFAGVQPKYKWRKQSQVDRFGLTEDDYKFVFNNIILSSFGKLLETELAQMYIRHSIKQGNVCPRTGQSRCIRLNSTSKSNCHCSSCKCKKRQKKHN